jgi:mono/diheme cytochrome c family protein
LYRPRSGAPIKGHNLEIIGYQEAESDAVGGLEAFERLTAMTVVYGGMRLIIAGLALAWAQTAGAQENLDHGKTAAQLFASDCAVCHKSAQGLAKSGGLFGIEGFLRQHYTASRESAAAIAKYLEASGPAPGAPAKKGTTTKRAAKGDAKGTKGEKKPDGAVRLPGDNKPEDAPKPSEPKASESKPAEPAEPKPAESKPAETKPAESPKAD